MNNNTSTNPLFSIENDEIIQKLKNHGYSKLINCLFDNESECYTKRGRLNKSATCRATGMKSKELEDALRHMRELLRLEFEVD